jgi:hypothetical protein
MFANPILWVPPTNRKGTRQKTALRVDPVDIPCLKIAVATYLRR